MSLNHRPIRRIALSIRPCSSLKSLSQQNIYSQLEQSPIVSHRNVYSYILTYIINNNLE